MPQSTLKLYQLQRKQISTMKGTQGFNRLCIYLTVLTVICVGYVLSSPIENVTELSIDTPCDMAYCYNSTCFAETESGCDNSDCPPVAKCTTWPGTTFAPDPQYHCGKKTCETGKYCELVKATCKKEPCVPIPTCMDRKNTGITCANVRCAGGPCYMEKHCDESGNCRFGPSCQPRLKTQPE